MTKLQEMLQKIEPLTSNTTIKDFFKEIVQELEYSKNTSTEEKKTESEWLTAHELSRKCIDQSEGMKKGAPAIAPGYFEDLRSNCHYEEQPKFFKKVGTIYYYNPKETFLHMKKLKWGKQYAYSKLEKNNFFGVNMEDDQCPAK
jgi:hypothetical protein